MDRHERKRDWSLRIGLAGLALSLLACRPVVTVGWQEMAIVFAVIAVLVGPLVFRIYRQLMGFGTSDEGDE